MFGIGIAFSAASNIKKALDVTKDIRAIPDTAQQLVRLVECLDQPLKVAVRLQARHGAHNIVIPAVLTAQLAILEAQSLFPCDDFDFIDENAWKLWWKCVPDAFQDASRLSRLPKATDAVMKAISCLHLAFAALQLEGFPPSTAPFRVVSAAVADSLQIFRLFEMGRLTANTKTPGMRGTWESYPLGMAFLFTSSEKVESECRGPMRIVLQRDTSTGRYWLKLEPDDVSHHSSGSDDEGTTPYVWALRSCSERYRVSCPAPSGAEEHCAISVSVAIGKEAEEIPMVVAAEPKSTRHRMRSLPCGSTRLDFVPCANPEKLLDFDRMERYIPVTGETLLALFIIAGELNKGGRVGAEVVGRRDVSLCERSDDQWVELVTQYKV